MSDMTNKNELEKNIENHTNKENIDKDNIEKVTMVGNDKEKMNGNYAEQKNNKVTAIILAILVALIIVSGILYNKLGSNYKNGIMPGENLTVKNDTNTSDKNEELQDAPDFEVQNAKGDTVKLSDMKGKAVVVNFWASWCGPCKSEMLDFDKMYEKYGKDIDFMMVNMTDGGQETKNSASSFIKSQGYSFPVYYDVTQSAAYAYSVMSIPATYFINKDGKVAAYANGAINEEALEEGISRIK